MNLFRNLFGRQHKAEPAGETTVAWVGESGTRYPYQILPLTASFRPVPANYIYARQAADGGWVAIYVAQTRDLHQRLEGHDKYECASQNGATHIHVHISPQSHASRCNEERDLIHHWRPVCNDPLDE